MYEIQKKQKQKQKKQKMATAAVQPGIDWSKLGDPTASYTSTELGIAKIESFFQAIGLDSSIKRFVGVTSVVSLLIWLAKPKISFDDNGNPKKAPFPNPNVRNATPIPWYLPGMLLGAFFSSFI